MIIGAEPAWLSCSSSFSFGSLFLFVVVARLLLRHESVSFVLDDVLVTTVKKTTRGGGDGRPSLKGGVLHQIRAAQTDLSNCHLVIWNRVPFCMLMACSS